MLDFCNQPSCRQLIILKFNERVLCINIHGY
jgi:hypothetical protein